MLNQYKNIDKILNAQNSISGDRFETNVQSKFKYIDIQNPIYRNIDLRLPNTELELHIYANDTWISGNHNVKLTPTVTNNITDPATGNLLKFNSNPVTIDLYKEFEDLNITGGKFRFVVNFHRNIIGNYKTQYLAIDQISDDRTELKLYALSSNDNIFKQQLNQFIQIAANGKQTASVINKQKKSYQSFLLNFSRNKNFVFVNSVVVGEFVYIKLLDPLPDDIDINFKCWIVEELRPSYVDTVSISSYIPPKTFNKLSPANWYANANYNTSTSTGLKNWNDLLGNGLQTSQQIIDTYFSSSGTQLNIDYRDFNNFVFYSSAEERVRNFKYKLELIDYYTNQSKSLLSLTSSVAASNIADYDLRKSNLIGGFDAFEKFLYYESSSRLTTYDIPLESPTVEHLTGSYITPVPKTNNTVPYNNINITSSIFQSWYNGLLSSASLYDTYNNNILQKAIPEYIRVNAENSDLDLFVNMLGHHYDILYSYINHMSKIHKREENPKLGMPNELLYSVAKQFGWNLTNGNQSGDLWKYVFGTNESGVSLTGSNSVTGRSLSGQDMTYSVWRRIVNNLPLLLKSKGTSRSIKALLSCYGIPQSLITLKEYGGPRINRAPVYEKVNFDYALDLINNNAGTVSVNYTKPINSIELRFRTDNVVNNPTMPSTMNLYTIGSNTVTIDYTSGTLGTIRINGSASANIEMFDGGWLNTVLRTSGNTLQLVAKRSKYGKIVATVSASVTASFASTGTLTIGGTTGGSRLKGQVQELRLWTSSLSDSAFSNHTKAPAAYDANIDAYDELVFRVPLSQKINHATTSSLSGVQPVASSMTASFTGWSTAEPYDSIEETYYYDSISIGAGTYDDNKIRIESSQLVGTLDVKTRAELSQYDTAPLDTNKLGVYFSPQTMINEDIIAQLGFTSLDDYIGDPGETEEKFYPKLIQQATNYWKKYTDKNDINAYIKIFTLFDLSFFKQLEQLLPARVNAVTGILIQPNLLERSKDTLLPKVKQNDLTQQTVLNGLTPILVADSIIYTASLSNTMLITSDYDFNYDSRIDGNIYNISSQDDDQAIGYLTSSFDKRYGSTPYSYTYLFKSGSTYITGSSPYWRREAVLPNFNESVRNTHKIYKNYTTYTSSYGSGSYGSSIYTIENKKSAEIQDYLPAGLNNLWYEGSKISSKGFNIKSSDTIDGGPVVEWRTVKGNQLIFNPTGQGSLNLKSQDFKGTDIPNSDQQDRSF